MNTRVLSKILGHASIQVTLDFYATVIDELMLRNVRDLKDKLSSSKEKFIITEYKGKRNAQDDLIDKAKKAGKN